MNILSLFHLVLLIHVLFRNDHLAWDSLTGLLYLEKFPFSDFIVPGKTSFQLNRTLVQLYCSLPENYK